MYSEPWLFSISFNFRLYPNISGGKKFQESLISTCSDFIFSFIDDVELKTSSPLPEFTVLIMAVHSL